MNDFLTPAEKRLLLLTVTSERKVPPPVDDDSLPYWPDPAAEEAARAICDSMRAELEGGKE